MGKLRKYFCGSLLLAALVLSLIAPLSVGAEPSSSHINVAFATKPDRPVVGEDTLLVVTLKEQGQQPVANASVSITAEKAHTQQSSGHAGMSVGQPMTTRVNAVAKPTANNGEYTASMKLPEDGEWTIIVTGGDTKAQFTVAAIKPQANASNNAAASQAGAPAGQAAAASVAPMEAIHASYLDLSANISDLRTRVDQWQKGDEASLNVAQEKLDRTEAVLNSVAWPAEMAGAIGKTKVGLEPMAKALKAKDAAAAQTAAKALGDASHDVTHAFYPDWIPTLKSARSISLMAPHDIYLDLSANINDLRSRVDQWQKGDQDSLNIAKEKADRIGLLIPHMTSTGVLLRPVQALDKAMPAVNAALEKKDAAAAQQALKPIADASHDLTHDFYSWMDVTAGSSNPACVQAAYLDVSTNISDLRARVDQWRQGDESSLAIAQEKLDRINIVLAHPMWPKAMDTAIGKVHASVEPMAKALKAKDAAAAQTVAKTFGDASHDVTHAYYADWLPGAQLSTAGDQVASTQASGAVSVPAGGHGHGAADAGLPNYWFVGTLLGMVILTIVMVPILKRREPKMLVQVGVN